MHCLSDNWDCSVYIFIGNKRENAEKTLLGESVKEKKLPEIRYQFVHDLWTDYALYLRKWILYIQMFPSGEIDASQEFNYYYSEKIEEERNREYNKKRSKKRRNKHDRISINSTELPDYTRLSKEQYNQLCADETNGIEGKILTANLVLIKRKKI